MLLIITFAPTKSPRVVLTPHGALCVKTNIVREIDRLQAGRCCDLLIHFFTTEYILHTPQSEPNYNLDLAASFLILYSIVCVLRILST